MANEIKYVGSEALANLVGRIKGKQDTISSSNKINADYIEDGTTNKAYTATEQTKLSNIASGAQVNVLEAIKSGSTTFTISSKSADIQGVDNLTNYYTKTEIGNLIAGVPTVTYSVVTTLPTASATTYFNTSKIVYLKRNSASTGTDYYEEYITLRSGTEGSYTYSWEKIGDTQIDLSGYIPKSDWNGTAGKIVTNVSPSPFGTSGLSTLAQTFKLAVSKSYYSNGEQTVDTDYTNIFNLNEDNLEFSKTSNADGIPKLNLKVDNAPTENSTKMVTSGALYTAFNGKVDKVDGKGLSTEDYTSAEKTKLAGIEAGAEVNAITSVNTKTGAVVLDADDISDTSTTNKFVTASDKTNWNGKQDALPTTTTAGQVLKSTSTSGTTEWGTLSASDVGALPSNTTYVASVKTIKTDNTTAQSTSASEAISGSGTINLHKVAKTGTYSDLINAPTSQSASSGGTTVSLVTTGEKYTWNSKQDAMTAITSAEIDALFED